MVLRKAVLRFFLRQFTHRSRFLDTLGAWEGFPGQLFFNFQICFNVRLVRFISTFFHIIPLRDCIASNSIY